MEPAFPVLIRSVLRAIPRHVYYAGSNFQSRDSLSRNPPVRIEQTARPLLGAL